MNDERSQLNVVGEERKCFGLAVTLDYAGSCIQLAWRQSGNEGSVARLRIRCTGLNELTWELEHDQQTDQDRSSLHRSTIRARLVRLSKRFVVAEEGFTARQRADDDRGKVAVEPLPLPEGIAKWHWLEDQIVCMARDLRIAFSPMTVW